VSPFSGIFTPIVSPIRPSGEPDLASLRRLVSVQVEAGIRGFWAMGTSSEFASFDKAERAAMVATVVEVAAGRPVIANVSDASTRLAIRHARAAASEGADAVAATPPYYFPHSQDEVLAHFHSLRDAVDVPLFVYNIPQTVRVRVELPTLFALMRDGTVAGMKDSQNDLEYMRQVAMRSAEENPEFALFAGTRYLIDAVVLVGAAGAIPSIANAFPRLCTEAYDRAASGDFSGSAAVCVRLAALENVAGMVEAGSRNAAILGLIKAVLAGDAVLESAALTGPLRNLTDAEIEEVRKRVAALEGAAAI
jgi:4-hydroxy-tetrahydrodipicolinate synthase